MRIASLAASWMLAVPAVGQEPPAVPLEISADLASASPNRIEFPPATAGFVRLVITNSETGQPCLDEMEVYAPASTVNLALAATGARASASSSLPGYAIHRIEHLNDGLYGNEHSWICGGAAGWVQLELPQPAIVSSIVISRDRDGKLGDRMITAFEIQLSSDGTHWSTVKRAKCISSAETARQFVLTFDPKAIRLAVKAIAANHPGYVIPDGIEKQLSEFERQLPTVMDGLAAKPDAELYQSAVVLSQRMRDFQRRLLLTNPDLDFDRIVAVKRRPAPPALIRDGYHDELGLPVNYCGNSCVNPVGWDNEIGTWSLRNGQWQTLYRPARPAIVSEVELHFSGQKMLFASAGSQGRWQVFEIHADGTGLRQVTARESGDVDNYDPMYLADGRIIFNSSAVFQGVP